MINTIHARIMIDRAAAIRSGKEMFGEIFVPVNPAELTAAQREELLNCPANTRASIEYADPYRPTYAEKWNEEELPLPAVSDASMASLATLLDARPAARAAYLAAYRAEVEKFVGKALAAEQSEWDRYESIPGQLGAAYKVQEAVAKDPRLAFLIPSAKARRAAAVEQKRQEDAAARDAAERRKAATAAERADWISTHGSARLRRLVAENIEHEATYRDERLALTRPGWQWETQMRPVKITEPRNPPEAALNLLDQARKTEPLAKLGYYILYRPAEEDEEGDEDGDVAHERGYVATAVFLGREIVTTERVIIR